MSQSASNNVLSLWSRFSSLPAGRRIFSFLVGARVPYASSIGMRVSRLEHGFARVELPDRRRVRNHLGTIHAAALSHLGELTANLALMTQQPAKTRWIVSGMRTEFHRKARGLIAAECILDEKNWAESGTTEGRVALVDAQHQVVAEVLVNWKIGPSPEKRA